uniref:UDP-N-acetylglucosamine diphosphorylase n=1 Tax=viral metagenome TaxID=1070528 RepID=A0A6C0B8W3_9ZZZZ
MDTIIIIMAGGLGKRMNSDLPKVLHTIHGNPMLSHVIEQSLSLNPYKIFVVVGKYKNIIEQTIGELKDKVEFIVQPEPLGTGHAIQCCLHELMNYDKKVLILSGDVPLLTTNTMQSMLTNMNHVKIVTTVLDNPYGYGRVVDCGLVKIVEEKDATDQERTIKNVNCGIYIIQSKLLCTYLPLLQNKNKQNEYYLTDIIALIQQGEQITVDIYTVSKENQYEIMGVNTVEQLIELEKLNVN